MRVNVSSVLNGFQKFEKVARVCCSKRFPRLGPCRAGVGHVATSKAVESLSKGTKVEESDCVRGPVDRSGRALVSSRTAGRLDEAAGGPDEALSGSRAVQTWAVYDTEWARRADELVPRCQHSEAKRMKAEPEQRSRSEGQRSWEAVSI